MRDRAYSKINLSLDVVGKREDGYHLLKTIMLPLSFYDEIDIRRSREMRYSCNRDFLAFGEDNTIVKMVNLIKERFNISDNFSIRLYKHIPIKAGLAGGSSDAACVLRMFIDMYDLKVTNEEIKDICLKVGADVLFCYYNTPAYISGIGDEYEPIELKKDYHVLHVKPHRGVSTKEAYTSLDMDACDHPDMERLKDALVNGDEFIGLLGNSLEEPALKLCREIDDVKREMIACGAPFALMSGSGSTVFSMSENEDELRRVYDALKEKNYFVRLCKVLH